MIVVHRSSRGVGLTNFGGVLVQVAGLNGAVAVAVTALVAVAVGQGVFDGSVLLLMAVLLGSRMVMWGGASIQTSVLPNLSNSASQR